MCHGEICATTNIILVLAGGCTAPLLHTSEEACLMRHAEQAQLTKSAVSMSIISRNSVLNWIERWCGPN